ncbi:HEPN domain-containing protein [Desulfonatronum thioautotrophicum]|uniref:HEPN domain-containing protein n=1 Tax=Desulfonatronum thioautotrophicum TaxID=617001 RepID=UPI0005EBF190|nr:HEPN domain-containing protein [Desulfonatronum thioautotrophicum]
MRLRPASEWLKAARLDLDSIPYILHVEHLTPVVAFHAQQSVEKSLKALLEFKGRHIPKTHKLQTLFDSAEPEFEIDEEILLVLDDLYIDARYPGDFGLLPDGVPSVEHAVTFYRFAQDVYFNISDFIGISKDS